MRLDTLSVNVDVQEMINEVDGDGDGKIDYNDFLILFREKTKTFFNVWFWCIWFKSYKIEY